MCIFILLFSFCISSIEGKSKKSLRFEQVGVPHPHITSEAIPDDSEDPNHYYVVDFYPKENRVAVYDVWYNISDMTLEAFSGQGTELQSLESNHTNRKLLQYYTKEMVFGNDDRDEVENTEKYPWNTIGLIRSSGGDCTGALISDKVVLTAAHCLYDQKRGDFYSDFTFAPGATAYSKPYGEYEYDKASVKRKYSREKDDRYDFGVLLLEDAPPVGHMGHGYSCSASQYGLNIAGYPYDKRRSNGGYDMFRDFCEDIEIDMCPSSSDVSVVYHVCDTYGGMSGSPMWVYNSGKRYIRAVDYGSVTYLPNYGSNTAAAITPYVFDFIKDKMDEWGE